MHYLEALRVPEPGGPTLDSPDVPLSPIRTGVPLEESIDRPQKMLILGGYSYGSLIAMHLPPIAAVIERFANVSQGTAEAEIRLRASSLAMQWNKNLPKYAEIQRGRSLKAPNIGQSTPSSTSLVMGGDECEPGTRRASQDFNRSMDLVRRSFERSHIHLGRRVSGDVPQVVETLQPLSSGGLATPQICYLLISPLLPPISTIATFFYKPKSGSQKTDVNRSLATHPTMAIYGDKDFFTSQKKLRVWAEAIAREPHSLFQFHEIAGAGHFWHDGSVRLGMKRFVCEWVKGLVLS